MRVTNQMMAKNTVTNLNDLRSRLEAVQQQVSTGKRFVKNSEDPTSGGEVMRIQSRLQVMDQWDKNLGNAKSWVRETETALGHMSDLISRARELSVQGANATFDAESRRTIVPEVQQLIEDLLATLNTEQSDGAVFGGFKTGSTPFAMDMTTGVVTYNGDNGSIQRDVGPGVTLGVNIDGTRFGDWTQPDNILTTLWQLKEDLNMGSAADVANNIDNLNKSMNTVITLGSEVGSKDKRLEMLEMRMKETYINLSTNLQQAQGVEMEKAIIELSSAETTYRAALQVGARVIPTTLADFLR